MTTKNQHQRYQDATRVNPNKHQSSPKKKIPTPQFRGRSIIPDGDKNSDFENAIKKFNKRIQNQNVIDDYKDRMHYEKPSERKKAKRKEAIKKEKLRQSTNK